MAAEPPVDAERVVAQRVATHGPLRFDEFTDLALYHPDIGFYTRGRGAGRRRDFLTSPEVGPLFGAVVARALDRWWMEAGRPERFPVVEAGAGPGTLARSIRAAAPACDHALELVLVETSAALRALHPTGSASRAAMPVPGELGDGPVVVLANELLDNLPVRLLERTATGWTEIRVGTGDGTDRLVEVALPPLDQDADRAARLAPQAPTGGRIPLQDRAAAWVTSALDMAGERGRVVVLDYVSTTGELAARPWRDWLRTYAGHGRGVEPLVDPGGQDITCEVAVDQLPADRRWSATTQADWLRAHGIDELVDEGRRIWSERAAIGDLAAVAARSRVHEAEALLDPTGLGAFGVLEWRPTATAASP